MANSGFVATAALLLVLLPVTVFGDLETCSQVSCGKGTCKSKPDYIPHGFVCECESGWRRTRLPDNEEQYLQFLPCIIPNCKFLVKEERKGNTDRYDRGGAPSISVSGSINYSCMPAAPPQPPIPTNPYNASIFNPCYWVYCGEGTCKNSSDYMHMCQCQPGAYNLFNTSHFPCYSDCAVGSDCSKLGIKVSKASAAEGPSSIAMISGQTSRSENTGMKSWKLNWMVITIISLGVILR